MKAFNVTAPIVPLSVATPSAQDIPGIGMRTAYPYFRLRRYPGLKWFLGELLKFRWWQFDVFVIQKR